jgi:hypothetical protein
VRKLPFAQKPRHFNGCKRTWGTKTCIALPAEILPPVTRHNKLWNIQLLAISLPPVSCLPKESMSLCCAVQKRPTGRSHVAQAKETKMRIAAAHRGMRTTFVCAASTARQTSNFTHAVRQVRELPTCLNCCFLAFGNEGGGPGLFFFAIHTERQNQELCFKTGMKEIEERGCESDEHTIGDAMLDHAGTRCQVLPVLLELASSLRLFLPPLSKSKKMSVTPRCLTTCCFFAGCPLGKQGLELDEAAAWLVQPRSSTFGD